MKIIRLLIVAALAASGFAQEEPEKDLEELFGTGVLQVHDIRDLTERGPSAEKIAAHIRRELADGLGNVTPSKNHVLIVVGTKEAQEEVRKYLAGLRRSLGVVVTIEARFLVLPSDAGHTPGFLDDPGTSRLLRFVERTEGASLTLAPRITCYDGQRAEIRIGAEASSVADYDIERPADGSVILDPVIERVFAGIVTKVRPVVSYDRKHVTLILEVRCSEVATDRDAGVEDRGVELSEVRESRIRTSFTLPDGGSVLLDLGRMPGAKEGEGKLLLLRAQVTSLDEEEAGLLPGMGEDIDLVPRKDK